MKGKKSEKILTSIQLTKGTKDELKAIGKKGDTYEAIILRLLKVSKGKK